MQLTTVATTFLRSTHDACGAYKFFPAATETAVKAAGALGILHMLDSRKPMTVHDLIFECAAHNRCEQQSLDFAPLDTSYAEVERALGVLVDAKMATRSDPPTGAE